MQNQKNSDKLKAKRPKKRFIFFLKPEIRNFLVPENLVGRSNTYGR